MVRKEKTVFWSSVQPFRYLKRHLHRYAAEFEFRYNNRVANGVNDAVRADAALLGIVGKRVLYRDSLGA